MKIAKLGAIPISVLNQVLYFMYMVTGDPAIYKFEGKKWPKRRQGYWFPNFFRYFAWLICLTAIAVCATFLVFYGLTFGLLKCHLWITVVLVSVFIGLAVIQPSRILLTSYIFAGTKSLPALWFKKIPVSILQNPYNDKDAFLAYKRRLENYPFYVPVLQYKLESRAENIKYHMQQRKLFADVLIFVVFVILISYIIIINKSSADYYSTQMVKHLTIYGTYTNSIQFSEVTTYKQLVEYLNDTLFPALYNSGDTYTNGTISVLMFLSKSRRKARKVDGHSKKMETRKKATIAPVWDDEILPYVRERFVRAASENQASVSNIYERSWTLDHSAKLIGKPRIRQLRVKNNTCNIIPQITPREKLCFAEFTIFNEERGNFSLWWEPLTDEVLTPPEQKPWLYESAWMSGSVYLTAKHSSYPGGGYVLDLAKNLNDSRVILDFMDAFGWVDARTRAVIVEFTLYSVNVNLFNVVYLIAERSASGYFITSYQINTARFMFLAEELEIMSFVMLIAFVALLLLFTYREAIRIKRTSLKSYLTERHPVIDIFIIILGTISLLFLFLRCIYVALLLDTLNNSQNNDFISFSYAVILDNVSTYINAILVCFVEVKLFNLLKFRVIFLQFQEALYGCRYYFMGLGIQCLIILMAFSFFFYLVMLPFDYNFSSIVQASTSLIGRAFCHESYDYSVFNRTPWFIAPLFYAAFLILVGVLVWSFFISVITFHLRRVQQTRINDKYNALAYLQHILTANEKTDIMRLKGGCYGFEDDPRLSMLRLRGGGAACTRCCLGRDEEYKLPPKYMINNVVIKRRKPTITSPKLYDFSDSYQLGDRYRFEAMRRITKAELETNELHKTKDKEIAMKALVLRRLKPPQNKLPERFYRVSREKGRGVVSTKMMLKMKEIVDNYGRHKVCEKYETNGLQFFTAPEDIADGLGIIRELNVKVAKLCSRTDKVYKAEKKKKLKEKQQSTVPEGDVPHGEGQPDETALAGEKVVHGNKKKQIEGAGDRALDGNFKTENVKCLKTENVKDLKAKE